VELNLRQLGEKCIGESAELNLRQLGEK